MPRSSTRFLLATFALLPAVLALWMAGCTAAPDADPGPATSASSAVPDPSESDPGELDPMHQWGTWRGPLATGVAPYAAPPTRWSETENVRFKVPVPGNGLASPVVWGDRIYLMSSVPADEAAYVASQEKAQAKADAQEWPPSVDPVRQAFVLMALSTEDGSLVWQRTAREIVPHEAHYLDSSWASASPLTDGRRIIAHFGSNGTYAYSMDGDLLWEVDLGDMETRNDFGEGASPSLYGDVLVVPWDHEGASFLVALDANTGEEIWWVDRPDEPTSWATPTIVPVGDRVQVVLPGTGRSRGYDLETGEEIWHLDGMTVNVIPSPPVANGIAYLASGYRGNMVQAVDLAKAEGDVAGTEALVWSHEEHTPYVPSLTLHDGIVCFVKHFRDIFSCHDAKTGAQHFTTRVDSIQNIWSSPVVADGRQYLLSREGTTVVLAHGDTYEVLAVNELDDRFDATPAPVGDTLYLRGRKFLYAITEGGGS